MKFAKNQFVRFIAVVVLALAATTSQAAVESFIIRGTPSILANNVYQPGATEFVIAAGGQKAAWGTTALDGTKVGDITQLAITRLDDESRFVAGSGPAVAPYFNLWITDGAGNFAVIANEPSNPDFHSLYNNGYDLSWSDISGKVAKVYENSNLSWLPNSGVGLTFADLANFTIQAPSVAELTTGWLGLGTGAPRTLANVAYGFNWVFGDTLSNYVSGPTAEGYVVTGFAAVGAAVPEPIALLTWGGLIGCALVVSRRHQRS